MQQDELALLKKQAEEKVQPGYIHIKFGYSHEYVVPHKAGIALLDAFAQAEYYDTDDYSHPVINGIKESPEVKLISRERYIELKVAHLLGLNKQEETE